MTTNIRKATNYFSSVAKDMWGRHYSPEVEIF
jgi:hypothetical protein